MELIHGDIIYSEADGALRELPGGWLLIEGGSIAGVYQAAELPQQYAGVAAREPGGLIVPGMYDLHLHAPQYDFCGLGGDLPLMPWLNEYAFPAELRFDNTEWARESYTRFAAALRRGCTARAVVFATSHSPATLLLMQLLEQAGLYGYVGLVSMDQNAPAGLCRGARTAAQARTWLDDVAEMGSSCIRPIITPRFVLSCSASLLGDLAQLAAEKRLPIQTHLSENRDEVAQVARDYPQSSCYAAVYDQFGLLGERTILAHCVQSDAVEQELLRARGAWVAHCPGSNTNLRSGIAPLRQMLVRGLRVGLGSDVGGGSHTSLLRVIQDAIAVSKLRAATFAPEDEPLRFAEAFYLATRGGGAFFGRCGAFEPGYEADVLALDDSRLDPAGRTLGERLQRAVCLLDERDICAKYVAGVKLW